MGWNYRLMRHEEGDETTYAVHEVYYERDGSVRNWTVEPADVLSDDRSGILLVLAMMAEAVGQPVLDGKSGVVVEAEKVQTDQLVSMLKRVLDEEAIPPGDGHGDGGGT